MYASTTTRGSSFAPMMSPQQATPSVSSMKALKLTSSVPSLFNYYEYATLPSPYQASPVKLTHLQMQKWTDKTVPEPLQLDDSDNDILFDEDEDPAKVREAHELATPLRTGLKPMITFYDKYRNMYKNSSTFSTKKDSATYLYLLNIDKMKQTPQPMGIVKWKGVPTELNLHSYKMGDHYAKALSEGMSHMNYDVVNVSDNRLTKVGTNALISKLKPCVKYLDLSENVVGNEGANSLGECLKQKATNLRGLNMESTKLKDGGANQLCKYLVDHPRLSELNLSKNQLTDASCVAIAEVVHETFYLFNLSLHWNAITGEGAARILDATTHHGNIKILDLSWNSIGLSKNKTFARKLAEILSTQENLLHLDLSHNQIKREDCSIISQGLAANHTLWGLHMIGNEGKVDPKGFLQLKGDKKPSRGLEAEHLARRINGRHMVVARKEAGKSPSADNCWVCEGWNEVLFEWPLTGTGKEPVYLHLDFEDYEPDLMCNEEGMQSHQLWRMCPPGQTKFFFTVEGKPRTSPKYSSLASRISRKIKLPDELFPFVQADLEQVNMVRVKANANVIKESYHVSIENCVPRPMSGVFYRPKLKKQRKPWTFPESLFRDYVPDTEALMARCFEEDWSHLCKPKVKEDQLPKCKAILKQNYRAIRETYKYYAAIGRTDSLFAINKLTLTDLLAHKIYLMDGDKLSDMDIAFMTIKGKPTISKNQPKTALVRFEFLEILFRLALKKFFDTKETKSESEAVTRLIEKHIVPNCAHINCQSFRDNKYWNEECDYIYKAHYSLLDHLYTTRSGSESLPGEKPFMCFSEFFTLLTEAGLISDIFTEREAILSFAQSMMVQVDELESKRHMKMQFVEFLEAIARASDILSLAPPESNPEEWGEEQRTQQALVDKIENVLPALLNCAKKEFRERFRKPEKDKATGLYLSAAAGVVKDGKFFAAKVQSRN